MASLKNRRGTWYARVLWYEEQKKKEKQIPLRTESKVTARQRLTMVNQVEDEIKELHSRGEKYNFPWMNEDGKRKVEYLTLEDAVKKWLKLRKSKGIADSTIERNRHSMNTIMSDMGKTIRLKSITTSHGSVQVKISRFRPICRSGDRGNCGKDAGWETGSGKLEVNEMTIKPHIRGFFCLWDDV